MCKRLFPFIFLPLLAMYGDCKVDDDGDGYTDMDGDCDDSDPTVYPGTVFLNLAAYTTPSEAIRDAVPGDVVLLCGKFTDPIDLSSMTEITIDGYHPYYTRFEGVSATAIMIEDGVNITLQNFAITDGVADGATDEKGGAMWIKNSTGITLSNVVALANYAPTMGGAFYINGSEVEMTQVTVSGNDSGDHGGGFYLRGDADVTITDSRVEKTGSHHALFLRDTDGDPVVTLVNTKFSNNTSHDVEFGSGASYKWDATVSFTCTEGSCY